MGGLGWIDFSPEHRNRVATVLERMRPEGRVDELGIGVIRDALSDLFFPGTSTIQTRAKYFIIIPRIFKEYQSKYENKKSRPKFRDYLRKRENQIIRDLAEKYKDSGETGIFGSRLIGESKNAELARKPSSIYWTGLRRFRIVRTSLSLTEYVAKQDRQETFADLLAATDNEKGDDWDAGYEDAFGVCLPDNNKDWEAKLSIGLAYEEADFLRNKIIDNHIDTLFGQILNNTRWMNDFVGVRNFREMCDLFLEKDISEEIETYMKLARDFDEIIHGAHIRYNCLLEEKFGSDGGLDEVSAQWDEWWGRITNSGGMVDRFDEERLLDLPRRLKLFTRSFIQQWVDGIRQLKTASTFDRLVIDQERANKGRKARLRPEATEKVDGWVGIDGLHYRFPVARNIVNDIKQGLGV